MGNGSRLKDEDDFIHSATPEFTLEMLERAAAQAAANFGRPPIIMGSANLITTMGWDINPEYAGTPWSNTSRMTKRERAVAGLHTTLVKLKVLKIQELEFEMLHSLSIKRLKRAKWARYQQSKKAK